MMMNSKLPLFVKKLNEFAKLPVKGSERAAGYDLCSCEDGVVPARGKALIKTGLAIAVPSGNYGRVAPRSGLALKNFIDTGAGVIDEDYRGEVGIVLFNHSEQDFHVKVGDRIAQLIIEKISDTSIIEVDKLDDTNRGAGGFGSTGVNVDISKSNDTNLKRKSPEGGFLNRDILMKAGMEIMDDDVQWKEWSILILYSLCESELISLSEKRDWAQLIFNGNKKAYELLREYSQSGDLFLLREKLQKL